jgi:hypothetical protein
LLYDLPIEGSAASDDREMKVSKTQEEIDNDTEAYVRCHGDSIPGVPSCGLVALSSAAYMAQMMRPDSVWCCPHCGSTATYNDTESERVQGAA